MGSGADKVASLEPTQWRRSRQDDAGADWMEAARPTGGVIMPELAC